MTAPLNYQKLKVLRQQTGISFSLCKKALEESNNNLAAAKKKLIEWGAKKIEEKAKRQTEAGAIFSYLHHNKKVASLIELQAETDFVVNNQDFKKLGQELAMQVASIEAKTPQELLNQEYIRDPEKKVKDLIKEAVLKFGENIKINRFIRWIIN